MLDFRFHPEAREELLDAGRYIKDSDPEQGELFRLTFEDSLDWACSQPLIFRCFEENFRKIKVGKFRYLVVFRIAGDEIQVLAMAHTSREPSYWKSRANSW